MMKEKLKIAVVGGGFGGIAVGYGLKRDGHDVRIFERSTGPRTEGIGFDMQPCGYEALNSLGIWDQVIQPLVVDSQTCCKYERSELTDATVDCVASSSGAGEIIQIPRDGTLCESIVDLDPVKVEEWNCKARYSFSRKAFFEAMLQLPNINIEYGLGVVRVEESSSTTNSSDTNKSVRLIHEDGSNSGDYDLVIAADGANSRLRRQIYPESTTVNDDMVAINGVSKPIRNFQEKDSMLDGELLDFWNRINQSGTFHIYITTSVSLIFRPAGDTKFLWSLTIPRTMADEATLNDKTPLELAEFSVDLIQRAMHAHAASLFSRAILNSPMDADASERPFVWYYKDIEPLASYIHPELRLVLMGDAAHAMLPWTGLGANTAFEDAAALVQLLSQNSGNNNDENQEASTDLIDRCLEEYDAARRGKWSLIQGLAREQKPQAGKISFWILKILSYLFPSLIVNSYSPTVALAYDGDPLNSVAATVLAKNKK